MKKILSLIPILGLAVVSFFGYKALAAGQLSSSQFVMLSAGAMVLLALVFRPKGPKVQVNPEAVTNALGDYAKDAFSGNSPEGKLFQGAVSDYGKNMPKAALNKLAKLEPLCRSSQETYAVARVSALCHMLLKDYDSVIRNYDRAIVLNPTSELAYQTGTLYQRLGKLKQARESYGFALDLDPTNIEAQASMATAYVASRKYNDALQQAMLALEMNENHASSLATAAICHGVTGNNLMYKHYTELAVQNGYSEEKIKETVRALKK